MNVSFSTGSHESWTKGRKTVVVVVVVEMWLEYDEMLMFVCRSKVSLKLDNSQCGSQCFSSETAAEFISQSLRKGRYKPVVPVASVQGMIPFVRTHPSLSSSDWYS